MQPSPNQFFAQFFSPLTRMLPGGEPILAVPVGLDLLTNAFIKRGDTVVR